MSDPQLDCHWYLMLIAVLSACVALLIYVALLHR